MTYGDGISKGRKESILATVVFSICPFLDKIKAAYKTKPCFVRWYGFFNVPTASSYR